MPTRVCIHTPHLVPLRVHLLRREHRQVSPLLSGSRPEEPEFVLRNLGREAQAALWNQASCEVRVKLDGRDSGSLDVFTGEGVMLGGGHVGARAPHEFR